VQREYIRFLGRCFHIINRLQQNFVYKVRRCESLFERDRRRNISKPKSTNLHHVTHSMTHVGSKSPHDLRSKRRRLSQTPVGARLPLPILRSLLSFLYPPFPLFSFIPTHPLDYIWESGGANLP